MEPVSKEKLERKYVYEYPGKYESLKFWLAKKHTTVSKWFRRNREKELKKAEEAEEKVIAQHGVGKSHK